MLGSLRRYRHPFGSCARGVVLALAGGATAALLAGCGSGRLTLFGTRADGASGGQGGGGTTGAGGIAGEGGTAGLASGGATALEREVPVTTVLFRTYGYQLLADNSYSPLMSTGSDVFFVWVDATFHPQVTHITSAAVVTRRLDPGDDYQVRNDGVHKMSLGLDRDGYLHVAGDMHHHPVSNSDHLPDRYAGSRILYWVSDAPLSTASFTFRGDDPALAIPGYAFSYGAFHVAPDGTLYFLARIRVHEGGHVPGEIGLGLYRYDTASRAWTALGALPPSEPAAEYPCLLWEDDGEDGTFFQGLRANVRFDPSGRMHLGAALNADQAIAAPTDVVYAASDDGGSTFHWANGAPIAALPLRVEAVPGQAERVLGPVTDLDLFASVFYDGAGTPAVAYTRDSVSYYQYYEPAASRWSEPLVSPVGGVLRLKHHVDPSGILTFVEQSGRVERTTAFGVPGVEHTLTVDGQGIWLHAIDEQALRRDGTWLAVYAVRDSDELGILRIDWR